MTMEQTFQQEVWQEFERAAANNAKRAMLNAIGYDEATYQQRPPPSPPPRLDEQVQAWFFSSVMPFVSWVVKACFFVFLLLISSIGIYIFLWGTIMQGLDVKSRKVFFDYSPGGTNNNMMPMAIVDLRSVNNAPWHHSLAIEDVCADNDLSTELEENVTLVSGQRYFFELVLTLPESDINKQLGVFMVNVRLRSVDRSLLASSKQHSMLPYESSIVALFRKTVLLLPFAFGLLSETRSITLLAFDQYTDKCDKKPICFVEIILEVPHPAAFPTSLQTIQIHSAELRYGKEMNAIQGFLRKWQYACAIIGISALFFGFIWVVLSILDRRVRRRRWNEEPYADFFDSIGDDSADIPNASSNDDRWMGADIEILDDSENDSNAWEPIVPNEQKSMAEDASAKRMPAPDNVVSDDESSFRQKRTDEEESAKFPVSELGSSSARIHDEALFTATTNHEREHLEDENDGDNTNSYSQKKEEEQLADLVMKG